VKELGEGGEIPDNICTGLLRCKGPTNASSAGMEDFLSLAVIGDTAFWSLDGLAVRAYGHEGGLICIGAYDWDLTRMGGQSGKSLSSLMGALLRRQAGGRASNSRGDGTIVIPLYFNV